MKTVLKVLLLVGAIAILRLNLPPNQVSADLWESSEKEYDNEIERFVMMQALKVMASETVADWDYSDFGIVRFAKSERLGLTAIGLPFCKWILMSQEPEEL